MNLYKILSLYTFNTNIYKLAIQPSTMRLIENLSNAKRTKTSNLLNKSEKIISRFNLVILGIIISNNVALTKQVSQIASP